MPRISIIISEVAWICGVNNCLGSCYTWINSFQNSINVAFCINSKVKWRFEPTRVSLLQCYLLWRWNVTFEWESILAFNFLMHENYSFMNCHKIIGFEFSKISNDFGTQNRNILRMFHITDSDQFIWNNSILYII